MKKIIIWLMLLLSSQDGFGSDKFGSSGFLISFGAGCAAFTTFYFYVRDKASLFPHVPSGGEDSQDRALEYKLKWANILAYWGCAVTWGTVVDNIFASLTTRKYMPLVLFKLSNLRSSSLRFVPALEEYLPNSYLVGNVGNLSLLALAGAGTGYCLNNVVRKFKKKPFVKIPSNSLKLLIALGGLGLLESIQARRG